MTAPRQCAALVGAGIVALLWRRARSAGARSCGGRAGGGKVFLVGAGPGGADLLTLRACECIRRAEVLVVDDLVHPEILRFKPSGCAVIGVPKRGGPGAPKTSQSSINELLVHWCATMGKRVVRLKGGDPLIFARVWPEMLALREAGCAFELVPGITSALAAPCAVGIPLTEKALGTSLTIVSGHAGLAGEDFGALAQSDTLVVLMGTRKLRVICEGLLAGGAPAARPVAIVHACYRPEQRLLKGTLGNIADQAEGQALSPAIIVIGNVAAFAQDE